MRVHGGQVDLRDELDGGGLVGVLLAAVHLDAVDAVLVDGLFGRYTLVCAQSCVAWLVGWVAGWVVLFAYVGRTEDGAVPVAHEEILGVFETVAAGLRAEALLALLELLEEAEVAWDLGRHCCCAR